MSTALHWDRPNKIAAALQDPAMCCGAIACTVTAEGRHKAECVLDRTNELIPTTSPHVRSVTLPKRCCLLTAALEITLIALPLDHGADLLPTADSGQPSQHREAEKLWLVHDSQQVFSSRMNLDMSM